MTERALPTIDRDSSPFWRGLVRHELTVQRCGGCGAHRFPPRIICARCHSRAVEWVRCSGSGRVLSWTVTHQRFHPSFTDVPYTLLVVELDEEPGLAMYGDLIGDPTPLAVDSRVDAVFEDVTTDVTLVHWRLA